MCSKLFYFVCHSYRLNLLCCALVGIARIRVIGLVVIAFVVECGQCFAAWVHSS